MFSTYITFLQTTDKRNIPNNIWSTVSTQLQPQSTYRGRVEIRGEKICIFQVPSQGKSLTLSYSVSADKITCKCLTIPLEITSEKSLYTLPKTLTAGTDLFLGILSCWEWERPDAQLFRAGDRLRFLRHCLQLCQLSLLQIRWVDIQNVHLFSVKS